jgi:hypothetical protein
LPHLVEMHNKKFDKKDFVAISVALDKRGDAEENAETRKKILAFLHKTDATMPNYWLEDPPSVWQEKLKADDGSPLAPPIAFVFDKDNHFVKKLYDRENYTIVVENLVKELLKK